MSHNDITGDRLTSKIGNQKAFEENFEKIFGNKSLDKSMGITNTEWCSHGQHYVKSDEITWLAVGKIGKRKLCESCKTKLQNVRKELKEKNAA